MKLGWNCLIILAMIVFVGGAPHEASAQPPGGHGLNLPPADQLNTAQVKRQLRRTNRLLRNREMFRNLSKKYTAQTFQDLLLSHNVRPVDFPEAVVLEAQILKLEEYELELEGRAEELGLMSSSASELQPVIYSAGSAEDVPLPTVGPDGAPVIDTTKSVVAIVSRSAFDVNAAGTEFTLTGVGALMTPTTSSAEFCTSVGFRGDEAVPYELFWGTGFLIEYEPGPGSPAPEAPGYDGPIIVTAGHVTATDFLDEVYFVFGMCRLPDGSIRTSYTDQEVRTGARFVRYPDTYDIERDFALVELEESAGDDELVPLACRTSGRVEPGTPVYMVGHPLGMPQMVSPAVGIRAGSSCLTFDAPLESYHYNSGSPVISVVPGAPPLVEGILRDSPDDFEKICVCNVLNTDLEFAGSRTTIVRITQAINWLDRGPMIRITNETDGFVQVNGAHELAPGDSKVMDRPMDLWVEPVVTLESAEAGLGESDFRIEECETSWGPRHGSAWRVLARDGQLHMDECPQDTATDEG